MSSDPGIELRPISSPARAVLSAVAAAMVTGTDDSTLDLSGVYRQTGWNAGPVLAFLAAEVEERSGGMSTVRRADPALFASRIREVNLYVATCPVNWPEEVVVTVGPSVVLYSVGPYRNGFSRGEPATPDIVAESRARTAAWDEQKAHTEAGKAQVAVLLTNLYRRVVALRDSISDVRVREQVEYFIRNGEKFFTLEDAAAAGAVVGVAFSAMLIAVARE